MRERFGLLEFTDEHMHLTSNNTIPALDGEHFCTCYISLGHTHYNLFLKKPLKRLSLNEFEEILKATHLIESYILYLGNSNPVSPGLQSGSAENQTWDSLVPPPSSETLSLISAETLRQKF